MLPVTWRRSSAPSVWNEVLGGRREFDRFFDRFFTVAPSMSVWSPAVDVHETDDGLSLSVELPGLKPEDVDVTVENGALTISGEKKDEYTDENGTGRIYERTYGRFERSFSLPRGVDAENVTADFENGVLKVVLPKADAAKPRKVKVKA